MDMEQRQNKRHRSSRHNQSHKRKNRKHQLLPHIQQRPHPNMDKQKRNTNLHQNRQSHQKPQSKRTRSPKNNTEKDNTTIRSQKSHKIIIIGLKLKTTIFGGNYCQNSANIRHIFQELIIFKRNFNESNLPLKPSWPILE